MFSFFRKKTPPAPADPDKTVAPNATVDITVKFVSPMTAGKYRSQWRIFAPDGSPFGQRPYVDIVVP